MAQRLLQEAAQLAGRGDVVVRQAVRVGKLRVFQAQLRSALVHALHEAADAAGEPACEHVAGVVGGGQHRAVEEVLIAHLLAGDDTDVAAGAVHPVLAVHPGGDDILHGDLAVFHGLDGQQPCHDLGQARGGALLVGVVLGHDLAGVQIHQDPGPRGHFRGLEGPGGRRGGCQQQAQQDEERKNSDFFHFCLPFCQEL